MAVSAIVVLILGTGNDPNGDAATGVDWLKVALGVLFLLMAAKQWGKRPKGDQEPESPSWMATIASAAPPRALVLGAGLSGANPKNLALTLTASATVAESGLSRADTAIAIGVFIALGSATVAGSVLFYLVAPGRAALPLAAVRQFTSDYNAVIMTVVLLLIGAKLLGDGVGGL